MQQSTLKSLYDIHSWIGVFLGLILYIVLFSGSVSMFIQELEPWTQNAGDTVEQVEPVALDRAVAHATGKMREAGPAERGLDFYVMLPGFYRSTIEIWPSRGEGPWRYDPKTGEPRAYREDALPEVLERLHTDLLIPSPYGRWVVGVTGVVFLISIVSGICLHRKILYEFFVLRLSRSPRLKWTDMHKSISTWALPFAIMIGLTGAMLGISQPVLTASAVISYDGDVGEAARHLLAPETVLVENTGIVQPVSVLLAAANAGIANFESDQIVLGNFGGAKPTALVLGNIPQTLVYYPSVEVDPHTAKILRITDWSEESWSKAFYASFTPLHYGSFGGVGLKFLYVLLGLATSLSVATGLQIWRQRSTGSRARMHGVIARLSIGVFYGLPLACALMLIAGRTLTAENLASYNARMWLFLISFACVIAWSCWRGSARARQDLMLALSVSLCAIPLFGIEAWQHVRMPLPPLLAVDLVCGLSGLMLLAVYIRHMRWRNPRPSSEVVART